MYIKLTKINNKNNNNKISRSNSNSIQVDILSAKYNICARVAGGSNAGHTIVVGDKTFKFHLLPSGMLHPGTMGVIGNGVVVHIPTLLKEMKVPLGCVCGRSVCACFRVGLR